MLSRRKKWPCTLALIISSFLSLTLPVIANYNTYEGSLPYRQEAIDAIETECGADVIVNSGEKYLFDSKDAAEYEASLYAAENEEGGYHSGPTRRKRSTSTETNEKVKEVKVKIIHRPGQQSKRPIMSNLNNQRRLQQQIADKQIANKQIADKEEVKEVEVETITSTGDSEVEVDVVEARAHGGSGGGAGYSRPGKGYGNRGGYSSHRGGYSHGGGGNYHRGGSGHYGYSYPAKPAVCVWTFHAADDCSLESHIIKFKPGDMDCYKQQLIISDNYTDFRMCGYQKLYPGFRAETSTLIIKYWKQPYTYRHVFKGYVTCVGRPQRPDFAYNEEYDESYTYPNETPPATTSTSTHGQGTQSHSNTATHHEQPATHGISEILSHSEHQDAIKIKTSPGSQSTHGQDSHFSVQEHHPQEKVIVKVTEDRRPIQQSNSEQVFTMAQVQEMMQKFMQSQKATELSSASHSQSHAVNAHPQQEKIIVKVEEIHQEPQPQTHQVHLSAGEIMANLHHQQVQEQVLGEAQPNTEQERHEAQQLMNEANAAMIQASHAQRPEEGISKVNEAKDKLEKAHQLLNEAAATEQRMQGHVVENQVERPQEVHVIVHETPHEQQKAFQAGTQEHTVQESVVVVDESHQPQPSKLDSLLAEMATKAQPSPAHEGNPNAVSQSSTLSSSNHLVLDSPHVPSIHESLQSHNKIISEVISHEEKPTVVSQSPAHISSSTHPVLDSSHVPSQNAFPQSSNKIIVEVATHEEKPTVISHSPTQVSSSTHPIVDSFHVPSTDESLQTINEIIFEVATHEEKPTVAFQPSEHSSHSNQGIADSSQSFSTHESLPTSSNFIAISPNSEGILPQSEVHSPSSTHQTSESSPIHSNTFGDTVHEKTQLAVPASHPISHSSSSTHTSSNSHSFQTSIDTEPQSYVEPDEEYYPILPHTASSSVVNPYYQTGYSSQYPPFPSAYPPPTPTVQVVDPYAAVVDPYAQPPVPYSPVTEYYPPPLSPVPEHSPYNTGPDYSQPTPVPEQSHYYPSTEHVPYPNPISTTEPSRYPSMNNYSPVSNYPSYSYSNQMFGARNQLSETDYEQIVAGRSREESGSGSSSYKKNSRTGSRPRPTPASSPVPSYNPAPYPVQVMQSPTYPPPTEGYQVLMTSPTDPNVQYVVTCQHPYPYPCVPVHANPSPPPPPPPNQQVPVYAAPGMYGR